MRNRERNRVDDAIEAIGGVDAAAILTGCTPGVIYAWKRTGEIPTTAYAVRVARASGIPIEELVKDAPTESAV